MNKFTVNKKFLSLIFDDVLLFANARNNILFFTLTVYGSPASMAIIFEMAVDEIGYCRS